MPIERAIHRVILTQVKSEMSYHFRIEIEQEADGRWIAEIPDLPGVLVYGKTKQDAVRSVRALGLGVLVSRFCRSPR